MFHKAIYTILLLLLSLISYSSDYYWIGGSGDWSDINHWATTSGGNIHHIQTPTASDNVYFDSNSTSTNSTINLNIGTLFCKDFNIESIQNQITFSGLCNIWKIYGSYRLSSLAQITNGAKLYFEAASGTETIKTAGNTINNKIYFKGNASWELIDSLNCQNIYLESGSFKTNSNAINASNFISNSTYLRSIHLGNSIVNLTSWTVQGTAYSVVAGSSLIIINSDNFINNTGTPYTYFDVEFKGNNANLANQGPGIITFHNVYFHNNGNISGDNIFDSLVLTKGSIYEISPNTTQTINVDLTANGNCKDPITIKSLSSFASFSKNSGTISCSYLILEHIHAIGGATFNAIGSTNLGDNNGWNLVAPTSRNLFWVDSQGDWQDTTHWSANSGGLGGECIPTKYDNVFIDTNSSISTNTWDLTINNTCFCHDFNWLDQVEGKIMYSGTLNIAGSAYFGNKLIIGNMGVTEFISTQNGETVHTSNIPLNKNEIRFNGKGSWTLQDSINNDSGGVFLMSGHLLTNGNYINTNIFAASTEFKKKLSLFNSTIDVNSKFMLFQDSLSIEPGTSHIRMIGDTCKLLTYETNPDTLYNVTFTANESSSIISTKKTFFNKIEFLRDVVLIGSASSDTLFFEKARSFIFEGREDSIGKALIANGNCHEVITMRDRNSMGHFIFNIPSTASINVHNVSMRGAKAVGGANFIANNSSDLGNNINWTFSNIDSNHYWVNGDGNWQDSSHWSYSSGGQSGACIPKIYDNVFFDANSFNSINDTVRVDSNNIFCHNMDWDGALFNPIFYDSSQYVHFISGNIRMITDMNYKMYSNTFFVWDSLNRTITMAGNEFDNNINFCDTGEWILQDTLTINGNIYHFAGELNANEEHIFAESYFGDYDMPKTLNFSSTTFNITDGGGTKKFYWLQQSYTHLITDSSTLNYLVGGTLKTKGVFQVEFNDVNFLNNDREGIIRHEATVTNKFNKVLFEGDGDIGGDNYYDTLIFSKGNNYILEGGRHQYITNHWQANADCYGMIKIMGQILDSSSPSSIAQVHKTNGNVSMSSVKIGNVNAIGNVSFYINNGIDLGNNSSNWQISPIPNRTLFWVNNAGDWYDTTHWSLNSGGLGGECIPTYIDDVYFDSVSFIPSHDTAFASTNSVEFHSMYWNYTPDTPNMSIQNLNIYGSLWLGDTMTLSTSNYYFYALDTGNIIRSANKMLQRVRFLTKGEWKLVDPLNTSFIYHHKGYLKSNSFDINTNYYQSKYSNIRKLNIENSNFYVKYKMDILTDSFSLLSNNSNIIFRNYSSSPYLELILKGYNTLNFNNVLFEPITQGKSIINNKSSSHHTFSKLTINNSADILGEHIFDSLIFYAGNTYQLENNKTQIINDYWFVRGNNCFALTLQSTEKNQQAFVTKTQGTVTGDFINMRDIDANGGALFYAGDFSSDISNNSGWLFSNGPQYVYGLGNDTTLDVGGSIILSAINFNGGPNTNYLWSTGSTNMNITINQTGWYHITVSYAGGCIINDSVWVGCNLDMNYNEINNICFGDSLGSIKALIVDTSLYYTFLWSNGDTLDSIGNLLAGEYSVLIAADSGSCILYDTLILLDPPPIHSIQNDTFFCQNDSIELNLGDFSSYYWSDNYSGQYRWITQADSYIVQVTDSIGCKSPLDTLIISEKAAPVISIYGDTIICYGETIDLETDNNYEEYLWNNNSNLSTTQIYNKGLYWVKVTDSIGCSGYDSIMIANCPTKIEVPNIFTPNGDGYNDKFEIVYKNIQEFKIKIYNRWGTRVFSSDNIDDYWDGTNNGQKSPSGVYFWEIIYKAFDDNDIATDVKVKGTVSLYRE